MVLPNGNLCNKHLVIDETKLDKMHSVWCKLDVNDIWPALFYSSALRLFFDTFFWQLFSEYDDDIVSQNVVMWL